jgi:hypothetical protein
MRFRFVSICFTFLIVGSALVVWALSRVGIHQGYSPDQPIAFSHLIHAGDNKIPCLYCHYAARTSRHAGIPPTSVCMNCHNLLEKQTVEIEKLKEAAVQRRPLRWVKIHSLPDFVYFNHSRHLLSGVACQQCHGPVERMERMRQFAPLTMGWCINCHREHAQIATADLARALQNFIQKPAPAAGLDCSSCHY